MNGSEVDIEVFGNGSQDFASIETFPNVQDIGFAEFRIGVIFAIEVALSAPPSSLAIIDIVLDGTRSEVIRVAAWRVVAVVPHNQAISTSGAVPHFV